MNSKFLLLFFPFIFIILSLVLYNQHKDLSSHFEIDSSEYDILALNFLETGKFSNISQAPIHTIGYPLFLVLIYKFFGRSVWPVVFIQVLLSLLTMYFLFLIALRFFNRNVAYLSIFFFSFNVGFLIYSQFILADILFVFLLTFFFREDVGLFVL